MSNGSEGSANYGLVLPFWIDTDAYTDRDRAMFVAGVEYQMVYQLLVDEWTGERPIHRENESRIRMMCGLLGVKCTITPHEGYEGCETWSSLIVESPDERDLALRGRE